jgi:hypothetical protein
MKIEPDRVPLFTPLLFYYALLLGSLSWFSGEEPKVKTNLKYVLQKNTYYTEPHKNYFIYNKPSLTKHISHNALALLCEVYLCREMNMSSDLVNNKNWYKNTKSV